MKEFIKHIETNEPNMIRQIMFRFFPYWPLFVILVIFAFSGATVYMRYAKPLYEISSTILVKDEKKGVDDAEMLQSLNMYGGKKIVENEIEILQSRALMGEVVKTLGLYAPVSEVGTLNDRSAYLTSPITIEVQNTNQMTEVEKVPLIYNNKSNTVTVKDNSYPLNQWVRTPFGTLKFSANKYNRKPTSRPLYFSLVDPKKITNGLLTGLVVSSISKQSTVISLKYKDEVPERGENILNELGKAYSKSSVDDKSSLASNTLTFLDERINVVAQELNILEKKVQNYKSQRGIVNLSEQGKLFLENVGDNDRKVADINVKIAVLDQVERYVVSKNNKSGIVPSTFGVNDPVLSQLLEKLYNAELEYEKLKKITGENNPIVSSVAGEIEKIRPHILENIQNQRQTLAASRNNISATNGSYNSVLQGIPQKEKELLDIDRQHLIKNSVYTYLLQKREETALSFSSTVADNKIIDDAASSLWPVSPRKPLVYLAALMIACSLGLAYVIIKELFNNKVLFRTDIENFTSIPVVAELSSVKSREPLIVNNPDFVVIAEQFRQIRAAIGLYERNTSKKKILITSGIAGEGKSYISANLALSLALSGKKVILLDLDLRNPKTSQTFNIREEKGIGEFLENHSKLKDIIIASEANKNLFLISAGRSELNPTELLLGDKIQDLFSELERDFDHIIVDSSPVGPITDAFILSEYCDSTLYVIRHGKTPKNVVQMLDANNKNRGLKNITIIFNGVKSRGFGKSEFGYGYGYGYGYEYVYKEQKQLFQKIS